MPTPRQRLRSRLAGGPIVLAPGIYDAFAARLVQQAGFEAAYLTGNGVSASLLGKPDVGLVDLTLVASHARRVAACIDIPLICDADTGYGSAVNVKRTVEEFEAAGAAAIHLEDQTWPKRCARLPGARAVVPLEQHVGRIEAALAARCDPDFLIIARTDAAAAHGLDEAVRRGRACREAGADAIFVELPGCPDLRHALARVTAEIDAPCLVNVGDVPPLSEMSAADLERLGFRLAVYPSLARCAAGYAIRDALRTLGRDGRLAGARDRMLSFEEYNEVLGLADIEAWERRYES